MKDQIIAMDCYPDKAQYLDGERVNIHLETDQFNKITEVRIQIKNLAQVVIEKVYNKNDFLETENIFIMSFELPHGNYGVDVKLITDEETIEIHTAFDVVEARNSFIRYGFLSDFSAEENKDNSDISFAVKLHLNTLQFYDWMYRHDKLVSREEEYCEPLGRRISLQTIRNKIQLCKDKGIRPFAYGAVYAASKEAFKEHPSWAAYKKDKDALSFADWLVFMDTSSGSPWREYIIKQYEDAVKQLGYQGIHMDTYGFPKFVHNDKQEKISLAETFSDMIEHAKTTITKIDKNAGVIFNAVNNWPIECVADSQQDAAYIEVWPPHDTYHQLYSLIREAKYLGAKQVILAAYLNPFKDAVTEKEIVAAETALLLTNGVIAASGGTQLVFGETDGVLCDSYYVNYAKMRKEFIPKARAYCDFQVRYGELLYHNETMDISMTAANGINEDIRFLSLDDSEISFSSCGESGKVWTIIRETKTYLIIQLINLNKIDDMWNQPKYQKPVAVTNIQVDMLLDTDIKGVYLATPDMNTCEPIRLEYELEQEQNGQHVIVTVPKLELWDLLWIEII